MLEFFLNFFSLYKKTLNNCYQKYKKMLPKETNERYQNLMKGEKEKNCQYAHERYRNRSDKEKEKKRQYGREQYKKYIEDEYRKLFSRMLE